MILNLTHGSKQFTWGKKFKRVTRKYLWAYLGDITSGAVKKITQNRASHVLGTEEGGRLSCEGKPGSRQEREPQLTGAQLAHKLGSRGRLLFEKSVNTFDRQGEWTVEFKCQAAHL